METGFIVPADLEVRQASGGSRQLRGDFPMDSMAVTSDRGRVRKEQFSGSDRPFRWSVSGDGASAEISLLTGHDLGKPLASRNAGSLKLRENAKALSFTADLPKARSSPSWVDDTWAAVNAGLMVGLSPGFTVPPASVVPDAEELVPEAPGSKIMVRVLKAVRLWELSIVSRPAYPTAKVGKRSIVPPPSRPVETLLGWF